jgi:hypothetical protein
MSRNGSGYFFNNAFSRALNLWHILHDLKPSFDARKLPSYKCSLMEREI